MTLRAILTSDSGDGVSPAVAEGLLTEPVPPRHDCWYARRSAGEMPSRGARLPSRAPAIGDATAAPGPRRRPTSVGPKATPRGQAASELAVSFERHGDVVVARIVGNLDIYTVPALQDRLATVDRAGVPLILEDRKSTRLNSSHIQKSRMPSSA